MSDEGFLSRWARRKAADRQGIALPEPEAVRRPAVAPSAPDISAAPAAPAPTEAPTAVHGAVAETVSPATEPPVLTLDDVARLSPADDFAPFVARGVPAEVKAAAMKKLFADPHYNIMDGLDIYIDDYTKPDPIPLAMLKQLNQSKTLRLFESDEDAKQQSDAEEAGPVAASPAQDTEAVTAEAATALPAGTAPEAPAPHALTAPGDADMTASPDRPESETRADASTRDIIGTDDPERNPDGRT